VPTQTAAQKEIDALRKEKAMGAVKELENSARITSNTMTTSMGISTPLYRGIKLILISKIHRPYHLK